ncbi:MAG: hypothetical protein WA694_24250 [Pseudolabrys sp.]
MGKQHRLFDLLRFNLHGFHARTDDCHVRIRFHLLACAAQRTHDHGVSVGDNLGRSFNIAAIQGDRLRANPRTEK